MKEQTNKFSPFESQFQIVNDLKSDVTGFDVLSKLLYDIAGISLPRNDKNLSLMAARLSPVLRRLGFSGYEEYIKLLSKGHNEAMTEFICQLTTNTTHFFREEGHFTILKEVLPEIIKQKKNFASQELRGWCSASSTGQEPYTIAMTVLESLTHANNMPIKILATDIDQTVLKKAERGLYSVDEMESVPLLYRTKYFQKAGQKLHSYEIKDQLRECVYFGEFNLTASSYSFKKKFDFIFCRNVLIYFDRPTATKVVESLTSALVPGGYLFLGHSESGSVRLPNLKLVSNAVYQKAVKS